ncbi:hypothetical protein C1752_00628 [Acaryochloris thomasi RCC1774]|uniref:Shikimate kinase n=1 Tax=Acaryochloris thomasi RCC1774 TaxID=1764569 RepID=A0A2W1JNK2_9CYAN|nr:hypothetical protein C1752_00628 [Acaryochloris thomasi RCC1774]
MNSRELKPFDGYIDSTKIAVIGCCGAGKSTLARRLGKTLSLPVLHLDAYYWQSGWIETPEPQWREIVTDLVEGQAWIMDGNYSSTFDIRFSAVETIIWLDFPRWLCLGQVLKRIWRYRGRTRADMAAGCPERFDWDFLRWVWDFPKRSRPKILEALDRYAEGRQVIVLRHPSDVRRFLSEIQ